MAQFRFLNIAAPGGIVNPMSGGTGIANNNANTITLGGPIVTAGALTLGGAFGTTFTFTGTTSVTFPTSGTLATTASIPTLPLSLANGGTGANLVANNGGIFYSNASTGAILNGTATANQVLLSGTSAAPSWSTATYPATTTINQLLFSTSSNVIGQLATGNSGVLITSAGGVPSISTTIPTATQSNITTVGTIGTGTWQGTIVSPTFGGTGINNGSFTLTLAGNLATSGAFASTFTMTAPTTVTFPTSGTLATTSQLPTLPLSLANGGTNANLTANNGGIFYSSGTAGAILAGTATAGQLLTSGATAAPTWTTSTYPATNAVNTLLYASSANVMGALATANSSVLVTNGSGAPSLSTTLPSGLTASGMTLTGTTQINTLSVGASGTAGSMNVFQATASKGSLALAAVANTGNTVTTISNAAMGQASTISIPDPGASTANFVLDKANQTIAGNKTFSGTTQINTLNIGASGTAGAVNLYSSTASSGSLAIVPVANSGNFVTTITTQAEGGAYTYTIPSSGANAGFLMSNSANGTESGGAVSVTALSGFITSQSLSTAAGSSHVMTFTNGYIASTSKVFITKAGGSNTRHNYQIESVSNSGNATVTIYNTEPTNAMNGTIIFSYFVIP